MRPRAAECYPALVMVKIATALSGGVDSAVVAARLLAEGHDVVGLTARLLPTDPAQGKVCCNELMAAEICRLLGISHHVVDLSQRFAEEVIGDFVRGYAAGLTPNPCLVCNAKVKFGALLDAAIDLGCDALATGHYAVREQRGERWGIRHGADTSKEQSYVLLDLTQAQLGRARLPLGDSLKCEVLQEARRLRLPLVAGESQDVCFIPPGIDYGEYLAQRLWVAPGPILDPTGRHLGRHRGLIFYTVGQRRGLGLGGGPRLYVLAKDPERNALIVGTQKELCRREFNVEKVNWISVAPPGEGEVVDCHVMVRYRGRLLKGQITVLAGRRCRVQVELHTQAIAPGQGAAFYDDEGWLLGGGRIALDPVG